MVDARLELSLDSHTGCADISLKQGDAVTDSRSSKWLQLRGLLFLILVALCVGGYFGYQKYEDNRKKQELANWLTNFYKHNAPEVYKRLYLYLVYLFVFNL